MMNKKLRVLALTLNFIVSGQVLTCCVPPLEDWDKIERLEQIKKNEEQKEEEQRKNDVEERAPVFFLLRSSHRHMDRFFPQNVQQLVGKMEMPKQNTQPHQDGKQKESELRDTVLNIRFDDSGEVLQEKLIKEADQKQKELEKLYTQKYGPGHFVFHKSCGHMDFDTTEWVLDQKQ